MSAISAPGLALSGEPRAQLLPPSVKQRERSRALRRRMVMLVVLAIAVVGLAVAWGYLRQAQAQQSLAAAQQLTAEILAQQGQYADAAGVAAMVAQSEQAQQVVTSTEIQWAPLITAVAAYVPDDVQLSGIALQAPAPWEPPFAPEDPLREPRVAVLTLEFTGSGYEPAARFVSAIPDIYGFADVKIDRTEFKDGLYTTTVKLTLAADAVSGRFAEADVAEAETGEEGDR